VISAVEGIITAQHLQVAISKSKSSADLGFSLMGLGAATKEVEEARRGYQK
jgi:hypothetical protein